MHRAPYVLVPADEEDVPAAALFDSSNTTFCAERATGAPRWDAPRFHGVGSAEEVQWLWPNRIPVGQVTLIEGSEGVGKSFVALDLAARTSRGGPWPDEPEAGGPVSLATGPVDVLLISGQDDAGVIGRRLRDLGADVSRIRGLEEFRSYDPDRARHEDRPVEFPYDLPAIEWELEEHPSIGLIVIDPLSDFCAGPSGLAEALRQLNQLAREARVAIVVTLPAYCRFDAQAALRVTSRWRTGAARCVWNIVADPEDPTRRLFVARRTSFCEEPAGLSFRLSNGIVAWNPDDKISPADPLGQRTAIEACLKDVLCEGFRPASEVIRLGAQCGFNARQLRTVAKRLGIESRKGSGFGTEGGYVWMTAEHSAQVSADFQTAVAAAQVPGSTELPIFPNPDGTFCIPIVRRMSEAQSHPEAGSVPSTPVERAAVQASDVSTNGRSETRPTASAKNSESMEKPREIRPDIQGPLPRDRYARRQERKRRQRERMLARR